MASVPQQQKKGRDGVLSMLDLVTQTVNLAKGIPPAQVVFGSVSVLLTMIRGRPLPALR